MRTLKELKRALSEIGHPLSRDNEVYISKAVTIMPRESHTPLLRGYLHKFNEGYQEEKITVRRENSGFRAANIWLREKVEEQGREIPPNRRHPSVRVGLRSNKSRAN